MVGSSTSTRGLSTGRASSPCLSASYFRTQPLRRVASALPKGRPTWAKSPRWQHRRWPFGESGRFTTTGPRTTFGTSSRRIRTARRSVLRVRTDGPPGDRPGGRAHRQGGPFRGAPLPRLRTATLSDPARGGTGRDAAEEELQNVLADVRRGVWQPHAPVEEPRPEPTFHAFAS